MKTIHRFGLAGGFVVFSGVVSLLAAPSLPAELVTHWNAAGEPDGTMSKQVALWLFPVLTAGLLAMFAAIPQIDPLRENIAEFRAYYDWFVVVFMGYMFLVHVGIITFNLGYEFDFTALILFGAAGLFYYAGVFLPHAEGTGSLVFGRRGRSAATRSGPGPTRLAAGCSNSPLFSRLSVSSSATMQSTSFSFQRS